MLHLPIESARYNKLVDTDAQGRPLPSVAPVLGRRSHARYVAWARCIGVVRGFGQGWCFGAGTRLRPARRGAFQIVGERVSWLARVTSRATAGQPRHGCVGGLSVPGQGPLLVRGHAASCGHALRGQQRPQRMKVVPSNTTAPHNTLVDTDAQGRPLPPVAPVLGRRSHARCTARLGSEAESSLVGARRLHQPLRRIDSGARLGAGRAEAHRRRGRPPEVAPFSRSGKGQVVPPVTAPLPLRAVSSGVPHQVAHRLLSSLGLPLRAQAHDRAHAEVGQPAGRRMRYNTLVDTDAQGRPRLAALHSRGRRSHARCTARVRQVPSSWLGGASQSHGQQRCLEPLARLGASGSEPPRRRGRQLAVAHSSRSGKVRVVQPATAPLPLSAMSRVVVHTVAHRLLSSLGRSLCAQAHGCGRAEDGQPSGSACGTTS